MPEEHVSRKLTTIVAADIVSYSRLIRADEEATLRCLGEYRQTIDTLVARHEGRIFSTSGDSVLAEFGSAVEAVRCAISWQEEIANRNAELPDNRKLMFRIGINVGDVMVRDDDLLGDGVNVAARLEGLAQPGGICVSRSVFEQVKNKLPLAFEDLGPQVVKNIDDPVQTYQLVIESSSIPATAGNLPAQKRWRTPTIAAALAVVAVVAGVALWDAYSPNQAAAISPDSINRGKSLSIAVLPFDNLSGDPDQEYFADAISEDLITDLSRIRDAFVIARRTSFTYKDTAVDVTKVASELGVRYVLEGSVQRSGNQVRINVQLIDGQAGSHIWSDKFDREFSDAFSVQDEITGHIASVLKAELREAASRRSDQAESLEAWDYALKGNVLLFTPRGPQTFIDAKYYLDKAIELDPSISSAWSGLAFVHYVASLLRIPGVSVPDSAKLALDAAQKSVALDPKNAEGHWIIGVGYTINRQPERAVASCETAIDLNPNNDCAYLCAGLTNMALGKASQAIPFFEHSLRLNPRFRRTTKYKYMAIANIQSGADGEAVDLLNKVIAASHNDQMAHFALASALANLGHLEESQAVLAKYMELTGGERSTIEALRISLGWMGPQFERVLEGLRAAGMPETKVSWSGFRIVPDIFGQSA
jgi:TolB-like protein/class 3 adenylate cyclase/Flp pilus assembly protein TadD